MLYRLSYNHMERTTGLGPALPGWEPDVLPLTLRSPRASDRYRSCGLVLTEHVLRH